MLSALGDFPIGTSAASQLRRRRRAWWIIYALAIAATAVVGALVVASAPRPLALTVVLLALGGALLLARPTVGVYLVTFLALVGDAVILFWYPFTKNLSSRESVFFVDDSIIFSPLELFLVASGVGLMLHAHVTPGWRFRRGNLLVPLLAFAVLIVMGLLRGINAGGDLNIALFEARPLFYVPAFYVLVTNLIRTQEQMVRLLTVAMVAVLCNSLVALNHYRMLTELERERLDALTEHSASIHLAALFVLTLAVWLFPRCSLKLRLVLTAFAVPGIATFLFSERRAAVIALAVGLILLSAALFVRHPRAFRWFVPILAVLVTGYLGAFWNAQGAVGFPAQAIKGVIAPDQLSEADQSSNLYREIEAFNVWYTIRAQPVLGIGFGQKFYRPAPMADISFFVFWEYLPHNSILWVWMKTGFAGFVALFFIVARTIQEGVRAVVRSRSSEHAAFMLAALSYVVMFIVFAYVDIGWEARSAISLAVAMACCADFPRDEEDDDVDDSLRNAGATTGRHLVG